MALLYKDEDNMTDIKLIRENKGLVKKFHEEKNYIQVPLTKLCVLN